ncbi:alpha/beta hydrolase [Azospirillum sp. B4]|uniref:alpha/beta hydrolase n=1 Tax=Azospirillum sp. B4 TaxID=95605 RepID=UPI0003498CDE|nr:alpha/beta fold hydrolase [Azospirillum sp. B4]
MRPPPVAMALLLSALLLTGGPIAAAEREVSIDGGPGPLAGTLSMPDVAAPGPVPAVLFISGSGPTDRNGNGPSMRTDCLSQLAQSLALKGIATLRVDKRGVAASKGALAREQDLRLETYVQDAGQWLAFLRAQPGIGPIYVAGHSEGGLIGILLAEQVPMAGLILVAAPGRTFGDLLRQQLPRTDMPLDVQQAAFTAITRLERGQAVGEVPPPLMTLFRPSVQPYLISELTRDPAAELARTTLPVLVLQGTNDVQVDMSDAVRLTQARQGVRLVRLEGVNHVLKNAPLNDRAANLATYGDPGLAINPGITSAIVSFVHASDR